MRRLTSVLCFFLALALSSTTMADGSIGSALKNLDQQQSYSLELKGRDKDGEYTATYLYTPELQVMRRQDKFGVSTYLYDKVKRADKVMVTRAGVAYMYSLDNPLLPAFIPGSFLKHHLSSERPESLKVSFTSQGILSGLEVGNFAEQGEGFLVEGLVFDPDPENDPKFSRFARYLRD